ncbi:MAG TPA: hypothetical protein VKA13_02850, partial [Gammaproteobacteria bacterium]|nr:hypothetical protein [Gammaproteobacteria bacterium]
APAASFTLNTASAAFGLSSAAPVSVTVHDCTGAGCAYKDDYVSMSVTDGSYLYELAFAGNATQDLGSDAIPDPTTLSNLTPGFDITTTDHSTSAYSSNAIQADVAVAPVPAPPALWLFGPALIWLYTLAGGRSRAVRGDSPRPRA